MRKFTKETTLAEILKHPELEKTLLKYNLPCLGCPYAKLEMDDLKIGNICSMYGIDSENLIKDLNDMDKD